MLGERRWFGKALPQCTGRLELVGSFVHCTTTRARVLPRTATSSTTTTSSSCAPTGTVLSCGLETDSDCDTDFPQNDDQEARCTSGPYKGCECYLAYDQYVQDASTADRLLLDAIVSALNSTSAKLPTPVCQKFCEGWKSDTALDMRLDSAGENKDPEPHLGRRTPPPDTDSYKDYDFNLHFKTSTGGSSCSKECLGAFGSISSSCKNGGFNNPMSTSGSLDVGCGVFSYDIVHNEEATPQALSLSDQVCRPKPAAHGDVSWNDQLRWGDWLCNQPGSKINMKPGDQKIQWTPTQWDRDALLTYTISWRDGCTTTQDSQSVQQPVPGVTCKTLLREIYTKCTGNEGVGGWRDAGCLRYEFEGHGGS